MDTSYFQAPKNLVDTAWLSPKQHSFVKWADKANLSIADFNYLWNIIKDIQEPRQTPNDIILTEVQNLRLTGLKFRIQILKCFLILYLNQQVEELKATIDELVVSSKMCNMKMNEQEASHAKILQKLQTAEEAPTLMDYDTPDHTDVQDTTNHIVNVSMILHGLFQNVYNTFKLNIRPLC